MKGLNTLRIAFMLCLFTTYSYNLNAQANPTPTDSTQRVTVVVRPGNYNNHPINTDVLAHGGTSNVTITNDADLAVSVQNKKVKIDTVFILRIDTITVSKPKHTSNKILFLELGGPGLAVSLNYDQRLSCECGKEGWGYRVGMGYFGDGGNTVFTIPLQINYLLGINGKYLELGGGTTFLNSTGDNKGKTFIFDRVTGFVGTATIGFRYEPEKSLNLRLAFVPIFAGQGEGIIYAGGLSAGYTF